MFNCPGKITKLLLIVVLTILWTAECHAEIGRLNNDITFDDNAYKAGLQASPNGYGIFFRQVNPLNKGGRFRMIDISLTGVKSIKEKNVLNQRMFNTSPYIYGKINRLYALRPMLGYQRTLAERTSKNSVGINAFAGGGITIGFLKPVYVDIAIPDPNTPNSYISVSRRYEPFSMDPTVISGYSSFDKGLGKTKIIGGVSMKAGVDFNWGNYASVFRSIEVGFMIDYFPSRPELLYTIKNKVLYSSFYISFALGEFY